MTEHLENQERFSIDELVSLCHVQQIQLINGLPSKDEITELIKLAADENSDPNCVSIEDLKRCSKEIPILARIVDGLQNSNFQRLPSTNANPIDSQRELRLNNSYSIRNQLSKSSEFVQSQPQNILSSISVIPRTLNHHHNHHQLFGLSADQIRITVSDEEHLRKKIQEDFRSTLDCQVKLSAKAKAREKRLREEQERRDEIRIAKEQAELRERFELELMLEEDKRSQIIEKYYRTVSRVLMCSEKHIDHPQAREVKDDASRCFCLIM